MYMDHLKLTFSFSWIQSLDFLICHWNIKASRDIVMSIIQYLSKKSTIFTCSTIKLKKTPLHLEFLH